MQSRNIRESPVPVNFASIDNSRMTDKTLRQIGTIAICQHEACVAMQFQLPVSFIETIPAYTLNSNANTEEEARILLNNRE